MVTATDRRSDPVGHLEMETLCYSFPSLRGMPGTAPWDQKRFAKWLASPAPSTGTLQAGLFVLSVWNGDNGTAESRPWWCVENGLDVFDAVYATKIWDYAHRAAFVQWALKPFYP